MFTITHVSVLTYLPSYNFIIYKLLKKYGQVERGPRSQFLHK